MMFMVLIGLFVILALMAVVIALVVLGKQAKSSRNAETLTVQAKITKLNEVAQQSYSVDSANARTDSVYYVELKLPDQTKQTFKISKKTFRTLKENQEGVLVYKGQKLISFT